jgi:hypothetical protein
MKKQVILSAVAALAVTAGIVQADEMDELKKLRAELRMQQQQLKGLLNRMEEVESGKEQTDAALKKMSWAENIKIKGDIRYRYEWRELDTIAGADDVKADDRERIRARIGAYGKVNDNVDFGVRFATGGGGATSTNETLDGDEFDNKDVWLDLAYVVWHPEQVQNLDLTVGKMKKPWVEVSDLIFDGDVNPEGLAANYKMPVSDCMTLMGAAGSFIYDSAGADGDDVRLNTLQLAAETEINEDIDLLAGASLFDFSHDDDVAGRGPQAGNNQEDGFGLYNLFASVDLKGMALPITIYGDYVKNQEAKDDDTGYLAGIKTKYQNWKFEYNYRRQEANSVSDDLNDGDFFDSRTNGKGHKFKVGYAINKNWSLGATYFLTKVIDDAIGANEDERCLQLDLAAKF